MEEKTVDSFKMFWRDAACTRGQIKQGDIAKNVDGLMGLSWAAARKQMEEICTQTEKKRARFFWHSD